MRKWAVEWNYGHLRKQNSFGTSLETKLTGSYNWKKRKMRSNIFSGWTRFKKKRSKLALIRYISASFLKSCYLSSWYLLLQNFSSSSFYQFRSWNDINCDEVHRFLLNAITRYCNMISYRKFWFLKFIILKYFSSCSYS